MTIFRLFPFRLAEQVLLTLEKKICNDNQIAVATNETHTWAALTEEKQPAREAVGGHAANGGVPSLALPAAGGARGEGSTVGEHHVRKVVGRVGAGDCGESGGGVVGTLVWIHD